MNSSLPLLMLIARHIERARNILLINPRGGDGDSFGSSLAVAHHCAKIGKPHTVLAHEAAIGTYGFLPRFSEIHCDAATLDMDHYDLLVAFDFADPMLSGIAETLAAAREKKQLLITIDHHATHTLFGHVNLVVPERAASAELVYELFQAARWPIDTDSATCLLTGILADTGFFAHRNTTVSSLQTAADLVRRGARLQRIHDYTYRTKTVGMLRLWGIALGRLQKNPATGVVTTFVTREDLRVCKVDDTAVEGIANFLNQLGEARAVLVLRELPGGLVKGSLRTIHDDIDVAKLAAHYGGGGHRRAAGFTTAGKLENIRDLWQTQEKVLS